MKLTFFLTIAVASLTTLSSLATAPVIGTTSFTSLGPVQTLVGSTAGSGTSTNPGSLGWDFTITSTGNVSMSVSAAGANPGGSSDFCVRMNALTGTLGSAAVLSNDASKFKLNYVYLKSNITAGAPASILLTGYSNGNPVASATFTIGGILNQTWTKFDVSGITAFNNVDQFRFTAAAGNTATITFLVVDEISISAAVPLPLTIGSFNAQKEDNTVDLRWTTLLEQNTAWFEIQRASDGITFQSVGKIPAAGNSTLPQTYSYTDLLPANAVAKYLYRLRMSDLDGQYTYSSVVPIASISTPFGISAYPNPVTSASTLRAYATTAANALLTVTDMSGRQVTTRPIHLEKGNNIIPLPFLVPLVAGIYQLRLLTPQSFGSVRLVKTH